ncbi:trehalose 6-phosphatase [Hasllibacter halocynthiae]|uniref:Trehalose 6-phosphate phosphatase n=1 Tax=Hasllibacter halocynthiae TaxID=595589 RepID=A0A2T0X204_9RHOB|nr:trehalose-phosphatase [Hasllibacter halocynthiae]PRY92894.1 trehalose 6-phosphatase [Hasllibacter halocynthiae]
MFYEMIGFAADGPGPELDCLPRFRTEEAAFFLDFDGVLVDLAETPDGIDVPGHLGPMLGELHAKAGGAVAIASGRAVADIRRWLPDFPGVIVGSHGGEIDRGQGPEATVSPDPGVVAALQKMVEGFATSNEAYIAEPKPTGVVLHFRRNPELRGAAWNMLENALSQFEGFHIHHSKMAFEVRPDGVGKENAIQALMEEEPFAGRLPVVFGDDVTDEPALAWAKERGGVAVKVGEGQSAAGCRLESPEVVHRALARQIAGRAQEPAGAA